MSLIDKKIRLLCEDDVIKAVDKHTNDDGSLDDDISCILEEVKDYRDKIACENEEAQDYRQVDYNMPTVLVIGSEGYGISHNVKKHCDINVILPMAGHVTSLNASVATAVLLYQVYNSRHPL